MKLIHIPGSNCYYDCLFTLAAAMGLDYIPSLSWLWAEGELRYDPICKVFLTERAPKALEHMGMKLLPPSVTATQRQECWSHLSVRDLAIVGMDACLTPWTPLYGLQNGPHYFILQRGEGPTHTCYDPTYGRNGEPLCMPELPERAYALIPVQEVSPVPSPQTDPLAQQAHEVVSFHPETLKRVISQADEWIHTAGEPAFFPARYAGALLTNRVLFRLWLEELYPGQEDWLFYDNRYYEAWRAVKHGFYKAALAKSGPSVFCETCDRLTALFAQEIEQAERILSSPLRERHPLF